MTGDVKHHSSINFPKGLTQALCVVVMFLFITLAVSPFLVDQPTIQLWVFKTSKIGVFVLIILATIHLIPLAIHLKNVSNGAPLIPVSMRGPRLRAWPKHSHPVARAAQWGPVEKNTVVSGKRTRLVITSKNVIRQKPNIVAIAFILLLFVISLSMALFPTILGLLVYEVTPPNIMALRSLVSEIAPIIYGVSIFFMSLACYFFCGRTRLAFIDKANGVGRITKSRFLGWFDKMLEPEMVLFKPDDVAGLQIAHHMSGNSDENNNAIHQYELILVLSDGTRHLLSKGSFQSFVLKDAIKLAKFLEVDVWDRSSHYRPDLPSIVSPLDPVVRPL